MEKLYSSINVQEQVWDLYQKVIIMLKKCSLMKQYFEHLCARLENIMFQSFGFIFNR